MLWSRATWPVWLSCLEHSEYTGNTHVPRLDIFLNSFDYEWSRTNENILKKSYRLQCVHGSVLGRLF